MAVEVVCLLFQASWGIGMLSSWILAHSRCYTEARIAQRCRTDRSYMYRNLEDMFLGIHRAVLYVLRTVRSAGRLSTLHGQAHQHPTAPAGA